MGTLINLITQASSSQDGGTKLHPRNYRLGPICTGLDTAEIGFDQNDMGDTLDASDADFVDEMHTLVSHSDRGHADFYPNGGSDVVPYKIWEHLTAPNHYIASIQAGKCAYRSYACSSNSEFKVP